MRPMTALDVVNRLLAMLGKCGSRKLRVQVVKELLLIAKELRAKI